MLAAGEIDWRRAKGPNREGDLAEELRLHGVSGIEAVEEAHLERNGRISIVKRSPHPSFSTARQSPCKEKPAKETSMERRDFLVLAGLAAVAGLLWPAGRAAAHHGWGWATGEEFELTGRIAAVRLGNPHGELTLDVKGEEWVVEIGQPWRNQRAGLTPEVLAKGATVTAHGHRSAKAHDRLMKAERLVIAGREHNLYPDRSS